ncbi:DUF7224 domain-containing protein [Streptomyces sp. NPDC004838]
MITWANLRASSAPWLVLPILFYAVLYIDDAAYPVPTEYGIHSGELAAYGIAAVAPAVAGAAAWEAGRHRVLDAWGRTARRNAFRRFLWSSAPVLMLLLVLVVGSLVMARRSVGVLPTGGGWLAVAHLVVLSCGWLVIGRCLGQALPRSIAAPAAGIGCWAWLSLPHATDNPWVRHLGGFIDGLSTVTDVRTPAVYVVPWAVTCGLAAAAWLAARTRRRPWAVSAACATAAVTLVAGRAVVSDWGYQRPSNPRGVGYTCAGQSPRLCVPPEYASYLPQLRRDALAPVQRLRDAGVAAPQELRIASVKTRLEPGTWPLYWTLPPQRGAQDPARFAADMAESAVAGTAALAGVRDCGQPGSSAAAWAALVIGVDEESVRTAMPPPEWAALQKIRRLPVDQQADWFATAAVRQERCAKGAS